MERGIKRRLLNIDCLCLFLIINRSSRIKESLVEGRVRLPQIESLKWRVDVTISNRYSVCVDLH